MKPQYSARQHNLSTSHQRSVKFQYFPSNFYNYIMSNSTLLKGYGHDIPSVKVRVSALTAESYNTITKPSVYSTTRAPIPATPTGISASGSTPQGPAVPTSTSSLYSPISPTISGGDQAPATSTFCSLKVRRDFRVQVQEAYRRFSQHLNHLVSSTFLPILTLGTPIRSPVTSQRFLANCAKPRIKDPTLHECWSAAIRPICCFL